MAEISHDLVGIVCSLCYSFVRIAEQYILRLRQRCEVSKVGAVGVIRFETGKMIRQ